MTVPFRILSLLLCLLVAGPMNLPAHAVASPETRVGNFFPASSKSASADLDQTIEPRGGNRGCGYDFASGVCKYLYAHGDPVNRIDPSRHISLPEFGSVMGKIGYLAGRTYSAVNVVRARAYVNLARVVINQDKIFLYLEATGAGLTAIGMVGGVMDSMAAKLLANTESISEDHFTRGRQIERIAGANIAANFEAIDDFRGGVATQVKSVALESGMDLDRRIVAEVRDHARELGNLDRELSGKSASGERITIRRGEIQHKVLTVAIPENHAPVVQSRYVRQALQNYRAAYGVYIQLVPVKGWRR